MTLSDAAGLIYMGIVAALIAVVVFVSGRRVYLSARQHPLHRPTADRSRKAKPRFFTMPASDWFRPRDEAERALFRGLKILAISAIVAFVVRVLAFDLV